MPGPAARFGCPQAGKQFQLGAGTPIWECPGFFVAIPPTPAYLFKLKVGVHADRKPAPNWPVRQDTWTVQRKPERRIHLASEIRLRVLPEGSTVVAAKIIDISSSGLCVGYNGQPLQPGTVVIAWDAFQLRLVWTRQARDGIESGFERIVGTPL